MSKNIPHKLAGYASNMPGAHGFTMAAFNIENVPAGEALYIGYAAECAPQMLAALKSLVENAESSVFEDWLARVCPSGDASAVQYDWLNSSDYADFREDWKDSIAAILKATEENK